MSGTLAAFVACGDDDGNRQLPDAPPSDGGEPVDAAPEPVSLTITDEGEPVSGIEVYFQNADSSLVAKVVTDTNGVATATVAAGAYVTAINPFLDGAPPTRGGMLTGDLRTFGGVQPGDKLRLDENMNQKFDFVNVRVDEDPLHFSYRLFSTCLSVDQQGGVYLSVGSGSSSDPRPRASFDLQNCGATTDMLVQSENGSGDAGGFIYKENVAVTVDPAVIEIAGPYTAAAAQTTTFTNVPGTEMYSGNALFTSKGPIWRGNSVYVANPTAGLSLTRPTIPNSTSLWRSRVYPGTSNSPQDIYDWQAAGATETYNYANAALRVFTEGPTPDTTTQSVTWAEETTGAAPDFVLTEAVVQRSGGDYRWIIAGVPDGASIAFPTLPDDAAMFNFEATDTPYSNRLFSAKVQGGYNAVRANVFAAIDYSRGSFASFVFGATGRMVVQEWQFLTFRQRKLAQDVATTAATLRR